MTQLIYEKIAAVMAEIGAITKGDYNTHQKFKFRGIDSIYNHINPILVRHKIFIAPEVLSETHEERKSRNGGTNVYRVYKIKYTFYAEDGSHVSATTIGEAMDSGDKASNKAMAAAHKYALIQVFCIPTEEKNDPDYHSYNNKKQEIANSIAPDEFQTSVKRMIAAFGALPNPVQPSHILEHLNEHYAGRKTVKLISEIDNEDMDYLAEAYEGITKNG